MKLVKSLLLFCSILCFGSVKAQDIHWTMFDMSPLTLNPAFTGSFEGTFRVGGIYRSQWNSISNATGFETPSFYVDAPILMIGKRSWLGVGGMLYNDERGTLAYRTTSTMGSAALHISMNKKSTSIFTIGIQGGFVQNRLDKTKIRAQDNAMTGILEGANSQTASLLTGGMEEADNSHIDFSAGVKLSSQLSKSSDLTIGLNFRHLTTPDNSFSSTGNEDGKDLPLLFTLHGQMSAAINDNMLITPAFIFQRISTNNEIGLQALLGYRLGEEKDMTIHFGPGYRATGNDAVEAILKFDYKSLRVGAAYDFNISSLSTATNGQGGFEIAASYIIKIYKKPTVKPVIFCPKF